MAFAIEVKDRLVAQGVGTFGTSIAIGSKSPVPANVGQSGGVPAFLTIIETGGSGARRTHNGTPVELPTAQLASRALTYQAAYTMIKAAWDALGGAKGLHNILLGGILYQSITPRQSITDIGPDVAGSNYIILAFNIEAMKQPS